MIVDVSVFGVAPIDQEAENCLEATPGTGEASPQQGVHTSGITRPQPLQ